MDHMMGPLKFAPDVYAMVTDGKQTIGMAIVIVPEQFETFSFIGDAFNQFISMTAETLQHIRDKESLTVPNGKVVLTVTLKAKEIPWQDRQ